MARNSRFSSTSGPSSNRKAHGGKSSKKSEESKRHSSRREDYSERKKSGKSSDRNSPFKIFEGKNKGFPKRKSVTKEPQKNRTAVPEKKQAEFTGSKPRSFSKGEKLFAKRSVRPDAPPSFSKEGQSTRGNPANTDRSRFVESHPAKPAERKSFLESRQDKHRQRGSATEDNASASTDGLIRLNKFISNSGVCSRREADDLIAMGLITVNGKSITELGYRVKITDDVRHDGKRLKAEKPVYILLNKPKGFITTTDDPKERNTVMQLIHGACTERVYPVGRLDRNTSGLLLLTNDGDLTEKLSHPSHNTKKIYKAELDRPLTKNDFQKIQDGVRLEEGKAVVDDLAVVSEDGKTVGLELHIGWNRIVRRIFEALGYKVVKLDRSVYATLDKKDLPRGHWRFLRQDEVIRLKHFQ